MMFYIRKTKASYMQVTRRTRSYTFAVDGQDVKNGVHTIVVFKGSSLEAPARLFFIKWQKLGPAMRSLFVRVLMRQGIEASTDAISLYSLGWGKEPAFFQLLLDASEKTKHVFAASMKSYLNHTPPGQES